MDVPMLEHATIRNMRRAICDALSGELLAVEVNAGGRASGRAAI
jgi:hypothetical protein